MKHKIVKIKDFKAATEALVTLRFDDASGESSFAYVVVISIWHTVEESLHYQQEEISFGENVMLAEKYIADFSAATAFEIAQSFIY